MFLANTRQRQTSHKDHHQCFFLMTPIIDTTISQQNTTSLMPSKGDGNHE